MAEIILQEPERHYTGGDSVNAELAFKCDKKATLKSIVVQLLCTADVHTSSRLDALGSKVVLYEDSQQLFPKADVTGLVDLEPGPYDYPFSFELPSGLPETFDAFQVKISWTLVAKFEDFRSESITEDIKSFFEGHEPTATFIYSPTVPAESKELDVTSRKEELQPDGSGLFSGFKKFYKQPAPVDFELSIPKQGIRTAGDIGLRIRSTEEELVVTEILVTLKAFTQLDTKEGLEGHKSVSSTIELINDHREVSPNLNLTEYMKEPSQPFLGSFSLKNFVRYYELNVDIAFKDKHSQYRLTLNDPIKVCPGA